MIYKIEDVLEDIKNGIPLIIVDDENRENEGDLFVAAEKQLTKVLILWQHMQEV